MRTLRFEPDSRKFERLYACCIGSPMQLRDRGQQKLHGAILDKLETIGQVKPPVDAQTGVPRDFIPDEVRFYVTVAGGAIVLEDAEYELLKSLTEATIPVMHKSLTRELEATLTWLEGLPQETARPKLVKDKAAKAAAEPAAETEA